MTTAPITLLANVAEKMGLTAKETIALPAVVTKCATLAALDEWSFCKRLLANDKLREYIATVTKQVSASI